MMPFCHCGCGRRVKRTKCKYFTLACVPLSARQMGGRKSRARYTLNRKARLFGDLLKRLDDLASSGKVQRGELVGVFDVAYQRGYENGYGACELKWQRRDRLKVAS
jgi:hypothetical protein